MKPLYNSHKGRTARPRRQERKLGEPTKEVRLELSKMTSFERTSFAIKASFMLIGLGVNFIK